MSQGSEVATGERGLPMAFEKLVYGFVGLAAHRCLPPAGAWPL